MLVDCSKIFKSNRKGQTLLEDGFYDWNVEYWYTKYK